MKKIAVVSNECTKDKILIEEALNKYNQAGKEQNIEFITVNSLEEARQLFDIEAVIINNVITNIEEVFNKYNLAGKEGQGNWMITSNERKKLLENLFIEGNKREIHNLHEYEDTDDKTPKKYKVLTVQPVRTTKKINRNDLCECGSQKKFKNCCINNKK